MRIPLTVTTAALASLCAMCSLPESSRAQDWSSCGGVYHSAAPIAHYHVPVFQPTWHCASPAYVARTDHGRPSYGQSSYGRPSYGQSSSSYGRSSSGPARSTERPTTTIGIGVSDDYFEPAEVRVLPGTTVRWVNEGRHTHTVTSAADLWDSGDLAPGASYSATFTRPGTYYYFCRHHEGMQGTIVVGNAGSTGSRSY